MIASSYACVEPWTMVVPSVHTLLAYIAVSASGKHDNLALRAELI